MTTLEITCKQFDYTSFSGENCATPSTYTSNFRIEGDYIRYYDETIGDNDFMQEIITISTTTLILKNINSSSDGIVTENWTGL